MLLKAKSITSFVYKFKSVCSACIYSNLIYPREVYCCTSIRFVHYGQKLNTDDCNKDKTKILVYKAPLKTRIKAVKFLSLASSMVGVGVFPTVMIDLCKTNLFLGCAAGAVSALFLSTPLMLHWITKRYVLELYYDSESKLFTATTFNLVNQIKEINFKASDVTVPELPGMLSSFQVKNLPLFVDYRMVNDPDAYSHMMGYDKPLNLTLDEGNQKKDTKT